MSNTYTVDVAEPHEVKDYICLALCERLYMPKRCLYGDYVRALETRPDKRYARVFNGKRSSRPWTCLAMAFNEQGRAVGIVFLDGFGLQFYVKKPCRRQGVGRMLKEALFKNYPTAEREHTVHRCTAPQFFSKIDVCGSIKEMHQKQYQVRKALRTGNLVL